MSQRVPTVISSAAARALCPLEAALDGLETARHEDRVPLSLTSEFEGLVAALERGGAEYAVVGAATRSCRGPIGDDRAAAESSRSARLDYALDGLGCSCLVTPYARTAIV